MAIDTGWKSSLTLEGERFDDIPYEELIRRADGLTPRTDYVCIPKVDDRSFYEKYNFFCNIGILSVILFLIDWFI